MAGMSVAELPDRVAQVMPAEVRAATSSLCHFAGESGLAVYLVGGFVRDHLLSRAPVPAQLVDLDLAVEGDVSPLLAALGAARQVEHDRFGTATVTLAGGSRIDLARTRSERYPAPAALPVVTEAPIEQDLARRDFTINAAAFGLTGRHAGELLDPYGGICDRLRREVRVLHEGSFRDDPTRLVRACRYSARFQGRLESATARWAKESLPGIAALSPARFGDAWRALLFDEAGPDALARARRLRLPEARVPGWTIPASVGVAHGEPERFWAEVGLTMRDAAVIEALPEAVALHRAEREALVSGFELQRQRRTIARARRASEAAAAFEHAPAPALLAAAASWEGVSGEWLHDYLRRHDSVRSPLDGDALLRLGVPRGPAVGAWQRRLKQAIWDDELPRDPAARIALAEYWVRSSPLEPPGPIDEEP